MQHYPQYQASVEAQEVEPLKIFKSQVFYEFVWICKYMWNVLCIALIEGSLFLNQNTLQINRGTERVCTWDYDQLIIL